MKLIPVLLAVATVGATEFEIGFDQYAGEEPIGCCNIPARYMTVAYADELADGFIVESFAFRNYGFGSSLILYNLEVTMGFTDSLDLNPSFDANYLPGTERVVLQADSIFLSAGVGDWCVFELDTPFEYSSDHNLLLEIQFSGTSSEMHNYLWESGADRSVIALGAPAPSQGSLHDWMIHLLLAGSELNLDCETFGRIKYILGQ